eukprot:scaffold1521_cov271-Chaetoceros_neogracile.AAC.42
MPDQLLERYTMPTGMKIKGAPIGLHWTFLMLLAVNLLLAFIAYNSWNVFWYQLILYGPFLFVTVLMHELARVIATYKLGGTADSIILWPLGGLTTYGPNDRGARGDTIVAIAGPVSHLFTGAVFAIFYIILRTDDMPPLLTFSERFVDLESGFLGIISTACRISFCWNLFLFVVHMIIPIYPLDGIRIWTGLLRSAGVSLTKTAHVVAFAGMAVSFTFFIYGCVGLILNDVVGGVTEFSTGVLVGDMNRAGQLSQDPIFGRSCYAEPGNTQEMPHVEAMPSASAPVNQSDFV